MPAAAAARQATNPGVEPKNALNPDISFPSPADGRSQADRFYASRGPGLLVDPWRATDGDPQRQGRYHEPLQERRKTRPDHRDNGHQVRIGPTPAHAGIQPFAVDCIEDT